MTVFRTHDTRRRVRSRVRLAIAAAAAIGLATVAGQRSTGAQQSTPARPGVAAAGPAAGIRDKGRRYICVTAGVSDPIL